MRLLGVEWDLLTRRVSTNCDLEVTTRKVASAQGDTTDTVTGLHQDTLSSYDSIWGGVYGTLVVVRRRQKTSFDREARSLRDCVCDAVRGAANETHGLLANASLRTIKC